MLVLVGAVQRHRNVGLNEFLDCVVHIHTHEGCQLAFSLEQVGDARRRETFAKIIVRCESGRIFRSLL